MVLLSISLQLPMGSQKSSFISSHFLLCIVFVAVNAYLSFATDTISRNQPLSAEKTITSKSGKFTLGFQQYDDTNFYLAIWYGDFTTLWVANRESPVKFPSELKISDDGNLVFLDKFEKQIWSTNLSSISSNSTVAVILDYGNLVLRDVTNTNNVFWQSCDHPTNTWLPGCYLGVDNETGKKLHLTSWKDPEDPAPGLFSLEVESDHLSLKLNHSKLYWSSGSWINGMFSLAQDFSEFANFKYICNATVNLFTYSLKDDSTIVVFQLDDTGQITETLLQDDSFQINSQYPASPVCAMHKTLCGPFGICMEGGIYGIHSCSCPQGFSVKYRGDLNKGNKSRGCVRDVQLNCGNNDVFWPFSMLIIDDIPHSVIVNSADKCELACLDNCSCTAYFYKELCLLWFGDLTSLATGYSSIENATIYIRMGDPNMKDSHIKGGLSRAGLGAILGFLACLLVIFVIICIFRRQLMIHKMKRVGVSIVPFRYSELKQITNDFSEKLGAGGFGSVFKGVLPDSTIVAVKKLEGILQGEKQFRSEVSTVGVVQHVNLVRLYGFCAEEVNKLLVYEYMPNGSLDFHLFRNTSMILDWKTRYQIALGTARGLSYLHEKCRDCIIHCDIKPENILLDASFVPKVGDFGLAKPVTRNFSKVMTTIRGTIGYLAPEWISGGSITAKADVYSYGMMLFEIISGQRNTEIPNMDFYFPVLAANKVLDDDVLSLLDPRLGGNVNLEELDRACKVACWCIQDDENNRPSMGKVVQILEGIMKINTPPVPRLL